MHSFLSKSTYAVLFSLLGVVYLIGLFVPLMDNDSAHHASIALHMYLHNDFVNLIDHGKNYLDKPHLHFWLAAISYKIFGVTTFAYKFPSFLFTLLGTYSTYRLGSCLYNKEVGRLAALIVASAFGYILANNDVRMDAILTASIIFAIWQLVAWINNKLFINAIGAALGLALGFCTKGHIAVVTPGVAALFYILYKKEWKVIWSAQFLLLIFCFLLFIAPVVYCYYVQYDLHPEKIIRGKSGRSGVAFILWQQNFERFQGDSFGADGKNDYFFFIHSFLWAFAPWSILTFVAFGTRLKTFLSRKYEWLTVGTFAIVGLLISFSGFKLPHYLNIIFPVSAVLLASYLYNNFNKSRVIKKAFVLQSILAIICLLAAGIISVWVFPIYNVIAIVGFFFMLAAAIYLFNKARNKGQQLIIISVVTSAIVFYLLNSNFYPQLLTYQGGNELAFKTRKNINPQHVYLSPGVYSSSYEFYTATLHPDFDTTALLKNSPVWILTDDKNKNVIADKYPVLDSVINKDYEITRLKGKFLNPATRENNLSQLMLLRIK